MVNGRKPSRILATTMASGGDSLDTSPVISAEIPPDTDLWCIECGYNLRGLSGDPRRCPECGCENPLGDVELPASLIRRQLRQMESAPTWCVAATVSGLPLLAVLVMVIAEGPGGAGEALVCTGVPTVFIIALWWMAVCRFKDSCRSRPGWRSALAMYHLYALALVLPVAAGLIGAGLWVVERSWHRIDAMSCLAGIASVGFLAGAILLGRVVRRRLKQIIDPLQREAAVRIAREEVRRRLLRQPSDWAGPHGWQGPGQVNG
jgi:hypothetical protein